MSWNARLVSGQRMVRGMARRVAAKRLLVDNCEEHFAAGEICMANLLPRSRAGSGEGLQARCQVRTVILAGKRYRLELDICEFIGQGWENERGLGRPDDRG